MKSPAWCTDRTASLRWMASVPNPCARSWVRMINSFPNLRSMVDLLDIGDREEEEEEEEENEEGQV